MQFKWKHKKHVPADDRLHLGFVAQEVEEVVPEAVTQGRDGTYLMAYDALVPLLVEAVKEQQSAIQALEKKVLELAKQLEKRK